MAAPQSSVSAAVAALVLLAVVSVQCARVPAGEVAQPKEEEPAHDDDIHPTQKLLNIALPLPLPSAAGLIPTSLKTYCIPRSTASESALIMAIDIACSQGADCGAIQPGGKCFGGNITHHASYVMNSYYSANGRHSNCCDFNGVGVTTRTNPSFGSCVFD